MHFTVERLPDEGILIIALRRDYRFGEDREALEHAVNSKISEGETGLQAVYDLRELKMSFGDLVIAMSNVTQKSSGSMGDNRFSTIVVGSSEMVRLGILAFEQEQYGKLKFPLFERVEDALKYAREQNRKRG